MAQRDRRRGRFCSPRRGERGFTLIELMVVGTLITIVAGAAIPLMTTGLDRRRAVAAARTLAQRCGAARLHAVSRGQYTALRFTADGDDYVLQMYQDGNRNGVRAADVDAGVDTPIGPSVSLGVGFAGVRIAVDSALGIGTDPISLGGSSFLSFSPVGTATAGSVYILGRDGTQLAVRVLGVTGRTRVLRYQRATRSWDPP